MTANRIDQTPVRLSTNLSIDRQTAKRDFGDRVKVGIDQAAGAIANGAAVVGNFLPGGAIVSAAVSSVTQMTGHGTPGGGTASASYAAGAGVVNIGAGNGGTGINTTLGSGGSPGPTSLNVGSTTGGTPNYIPGGSADSSAAAFNSQLVTSQQDNAKMIQMQITMQRENQVFTTLSNVIKTRHDTVKNSISNVR
jgi:hypothetical protein